MITRRVWIAALGAQIALGATPAPAQTPPKKMLRVGVLAPSSRTQEEIVLKPFYAGMAELGWVEGRNISYDRVFADNDTARLPALALELAARRPDLIYATATLSALAARQATRTIPIVFGTAREPVAIGLVDSLARPGGNVTGLSSMASELGPKRLQLFHEMLPRVKRFGVLFEPADPGSRLEKQLLEQAQRSLGITVLFAEVTRPQDIDAAVGALIDARAEALLSTSSTTIHNSRRQLIALAGRRRLPVFGQNSEFPKDGALASYGTNVRALLHRSAYLVDKVLKGTSPASIAVEQPTRFEFVVNLKTAKALGLKIPERALLRADEVIE